MATVKERAELRKNIKHIKAALKMLTETVVESSTVPLGETMLIIELSERLLQLQRTLNALSSVVDEQKLLARAQRRNRRRGK